MEKFYLDSDLIVSIVSNGYVIRSGEDTVVIDAEYDEIGANFALLNIVLEYVGQFTYGNKTVVIRKGLREPCEVDNCDDDVYEMLNDIWYDLPVVGVDLRCEKHPQYTGDKKPDNDCKICNMLYKIKNYGMSGKEDC